jgi:prepilin-type N-terminal cleavage/methylation domain-containing protein
MSRGFTLLEMLVALTVASVLLVGLAGLTGQLGRGLEKNRAARDTAFEAYAALNLFDDDLTQYLSGFGADSPARFGFTTLRDAGWASPENGDRTSGRFSVTYETRTEGPSPTPVLYRVWKDAALDVEPQETKLAEGFAVEAAYMSKQNDVLGAWPANTEPPVAVRLRLTAPDGRQWERTTPLMGRTP